MTMGSKRGKRKRSTDGHGQAEQKRKRASGENAVESTSKAEAEKIPVQGEGTDDHNQSQNQCRGTVSDMEQNGGDCNTNDTIVKPPSSPSPSGKVMSESCGMSDSLKECKTSEGQGEKQAEPCETTVCEMPDFPQVDTETSAEKDNKTTNSSEPNDLSDFWKESKSLAGENTDIASGVRGEISEKALSESKISQDGNQSENEFDRSLTKEKKKCNDISMEEIESKERQEQKIEKNSQNSKELSSEKLTEGTQQPVKKSDPNTKESFDEENQQDTKQTDENTKDLFVEEAATAKEPDTKMLDQNTKGLFVEETTVEQTKKSTLESCANEMKDSHFQDVSQMQGTVLESSKRSIFEDKNETFTSADLNPGIGDEKQNAYKADEKEKDDIKEDIANPETLATPEVSSANQRKDEAELEKMRNETRTNTVERTKDGADDTKKEQLKENQTLSSSTPKPDNQCPTEKETISDDKNENKENITQMSEIWQSMGTMQNKAQEKSTYPEKAESNTSSTLEHPKQHIQETTIQKKSETSKKNSASSEKAERSSGTILEHPKQHSKEITFPEKSESSNDQNVKDILAKPLPNPAGDSASVQQTYKIPAELAKDREMVIERGEKVGEKSEEEISVSVAGKKARGGKLEGFAEDLGPSGSQVFPDDANLFDMDVTDSQLCAMTDDDARQRKTITNRGDCNSSSSNRTERE